MNNYQKELSRLLETFSTMSHEFAKNNRKLLPAIYSKGKSCNDPETDRLDECLAFMMAQSNVRFLENSSVMAMNDLSKFLPEWFEPAVSSIILKAKITDWNNWRHRHYPEETLFAHYLKNKNNQELSFSNDLPVKLVPLDITESYFTYINDQYCAVLKLKSYEKINKLEKVKIFIDYSKFSNFYRFLDEIFFTKQKIEVIKKNKSYFTNVNRENIAYSFLDLFDLSIYSESNFTYYLYQFVNYLNNYTFINFDFSMFQFEMENEEEIKIIIPLSEYIKDSSQVNNYAYTNCFASKNKNVQRGDPIYLKKGTKPYLTLDRASKKNFIGIKKIQFFDLEHKDLNLELNKDYRIYKKFIMDDKSLDIIYYLKICKVIDRDIIILPYFNYSDLTTAHVVQVKSNLVLKRNHKYLFENLTVPSRTTFYIENFKDNYFYSNIFLMNSKIIEENLSIKNIFKTLQYFSEMSLSYKGIITKIISQLNLIREINDKKQVHNAHGAFHQKRYHVVFELNKKNYQFGGVSILIKFIETLLNKASKLNSVYKIELKETK